MKANLWENFKKMPLILKFLTIHALACLFFLVSSIFPHNSFSVEGRAVSFLEWWTSGAGMLASIFGILLPLSGFLLIKRAPLARLFYLSSMFIGFFSPMFFLDGSKYPSVYYLSSLAIVLLIAGYLFFGKTSKEYFTSKEGLHASA